MGIRKRVLIRETITSDEMGRGCAPITRAFMPSNHKVRSAQMVFEILHTSPGRLHIFCLGHLRVVV